MILRGLFPGLMLLALGVPGGAKAQGDALVSKEITLAVSDDEYAYVFGDSALHYSRVDLFREPLEIRNGSIALKSPLLGGVGRPQSVLLYFQAVRTDSVYVSGLAQLHRNGKTGFDSLVIDRPAATRNRINDGVRISALALQGDDSLIVAAGRAGFARTALRAAGAGEGPALASDSLVFNTLLAGRDSAVTAVACVLKIPCDVDTLAGLANTVGEPDSVTALALAPHPDDGDFLLIGTQRGLRRGLAGSGFYPSVSLPGVPDSLELAIDAVHASPDEPIVWVFSRSRYYYSDDYGESFRVPPDLDGAPFKASEITGFNRPPQATFRGDTTFINFFLDDPGLVAFHRDSIVANAGSGLEGVLIEAEDGLPVDRDANRISSLTSVRRGDAFALVVGTTAQGIFYRRSGGGFNDDWMNENKLREVKGSLREVITFPTLFTGRTASGDEEFVHVGYKLEKDARVTITVYNYAMEKVKTLVRNAPRRGGGSRSENQAEDRWDGRDSSGRKVSVGTYYLLVQTDRGEKGWGKAIVVRGK